ncbi:MAG: hypothetical protein R8G66_26095 [Cytophagales bacterium]|nr:hypothetical protein [Cytophagales bacterium]
MNTEYMVINTENGILQKLLDRHNGDVKELESELEKILPFTGYSDKYKLEEELDRSQNEHKGDILEKSSAALKPYNLWVVFFEYIYGIKAEEFGIKEDNPLLSELKNVRGQKSTSTILSLRDFGNENKETLQQKYEQAILDYLDKLDDSLHVYDYLERHRYELEDYFDSQISNDAYMKVHKKGYNEIEKKIFPLDLSGEPKARYKRYLALPFKHEFIPSKKDVESLKFEILSCLSLPLFQHICNCFKQAPKIGYSYTDYGFYMLNYPTRIYHYALLNRTEHFLLEQYSYDSDGVCKPDILHVGANSKAHQQRIKVYRDDFVRLRGKEKPKFDLINVLDNLEKLVEKMTSKINNPDRHTTSKVVEKWKNQRNVYQEMKAYILSLNLDPELLYLTTN